MKPDAESERRTANALFDKIEILVKKRDELKRVLEASEDPESLTDECARLREMNSQALPELLKKFKDARNAMTDPVARERVQQAIDKVKLARVGFGIERRFDLSDGKLYTLKSQLEEASTNAKRGEIAGEIRQLEALRKEISATNESETMGSLANPQRQKKPKMTQSKAKRILRELTPDMESFLRAVGL